MIRALLAGLGFAWIAGPLGCFVVWRRMSFFGDTLSHGSLCGLALGVLLGMDPFFTVLAVCMGISGLLAWFRADSLGSDTFLALASQGVLALGLVCVTLVKGVRLDLNAYLFGDILSVGSEDIYLIWGAGLLIGTLLYFMWPILLSMTIAEDLATVEGLPIKKTYALYMMILALFVAVSIKIVGVLLITALMILPAALVRPFSKSPEQMAFLAALSAMIMILMGLCLSSFYDIPVAPSVVLTGLGFLGGAFFFTPKKS